MSRMRRWWQQPDQFDWTTRFLRQRGLLRSAQIVMATVAGSASLIPLTFLIGLQQSTARVWIVGLFGATFTIAVTASSLARWPTRRQSEFTTVIGTVFIAAWSLAQPTAAMAVLTCTAIAVTSGYLAAFHSTKVLTFNVVTAVVIATIGSVRLAHDTDLATAAAAFWIVWLLNLSVPLGVRGLSRAITLYALRSEADPLTGLLNRRAFTEAITRLLADDADAKYMGVLMIDIDDFKKINDTHGHAAGDEAILAIAELLQQRSPPGAAVCRSGGEEFLIATTFTKADYAVALATQLCAAIAALPQRVTASIGTSTAELNTHPRRTGLDELIAAADAAMYIAKRNGGNQAHHV
jgi:diguanylate cyclase (GGDEF)-like protein